MDGGERRHSQYGASYPSTGPGRPAPGQSMGPPSQDSYSQTASSPLRRSMSEHPAGRPYLQEYGYAYQQPQFQSQLQYPSSYVQDAARAHQVPATQSQQQYASYSHGAMLPPVGQSAMYETLPQFQQQRQSTAIEVMTGQFGAGGLHYLPQHEPGSSVGAGQPSSHYLSSQSDQQAYGSVSFPRPQLQPPFAPTATEYSLLEQTGSQVGSEEASSRQATEEGKRQYEIRLRETFTDINAGRVTDASEKLVALTEWLIGSVRPLGLHYDDEHAQDQRTTLWRELNHAWEALGLKQKTITENAIRTRQQPSDFLTSSALQTLVDKLVQLCDQIEKYGLVDYEMGIWEEQIVDIFIQCLDLLPHEQARAGQGQNER